jgi:hypothetical protein
MINQALEIPPLSRDVAKWELGDFDGRRRVPMHQLDGVRVFSDHQNGIRLVWAIEDKKPRGVCLKPHEARALGQLLIAAADDVLPFRKAGT